MKLKTKDSIRIALMTAILCICSWITIPMTVPLTMQIFGVFSALLILGGKKGMIAIGLYTMLGVIGLPVFSNFQGGIGHLAGPLGGFVVGFLCMSLLYMAGEKHVGRKGRIALLAVGLFVCYLIGTVWFMVVSDSGKSFWAVAAVCVLPYIIPDLIKLLLADIVSEKVRRHALRS